MDPSTSTILATAPAAEDSGVLQPPPDMKEIIDVTATWVAQKGSTFESKVKEDNKNKPQFAFLRPGNPYYAYYQQKVREIRKNEVIADVGDRESVQNAVEVKMHLKKAMLGELPIDAPESLAKKEKKKPLLPRKEDLSPPPPERWVLEKPNISALQDDIIKLSAQFMARNGTTFESGLLERERKNPQFGFLLPIHPLHQYYQKLVNAYRRCLLPEKDLIEQIQQQAKNKSIILDRVMKKIQWERAQKKSEDQKKAEEDEEKNAMALIDWHDFTVVQTIEYDEEEDENEPPPVPDVKIPTVPAPDEPKVPVENKDDIEDVDMEMDEDEDFEPEPQPASIKVRTDFHPRVRVTPQLHDTKVITPAGQQIDSKEAALAVKIELANKNVLEQKKIIKQTERESNIASGEEVALHLKRFAERTEILRDKDANEEKKKKTLDKPTWDGHSSSIPRVAMEAIGGMTVRQQIKAIHESKGLTGETTEPAIGPKLANTPHKQPTSVPPGNFQSGRPPYGGPQHQPMQMRPPFQSPTGVIKPPPGTGFSPNQRMDKVGERPHIDEPPAKRQKTGDYSDEITRQLIPEKDFLQRHPGPINAIIKVPTQQEVKSKFPLNGQTIRIPLNMTDTIKTLKETLGEQLGGLPINKQKLRVEGLGFLKDTNTFAFYNALDGFEIELGLKERGGRKK